MASRARKTAELASDATEFDPAKLERDAGDDTSAINAERAAQAQQVVQQVATAAEMPQENGNGHSSGIARKQYKPAPDPRGNHIIMLSPDPKGPKARLLRSNDHQAMLIQFSENPGKEITDQIKEAGFRWESRAQSDFAKGAWVIGLEPGNEWRNHAHAEAVFKDAVNQVRERNGMDPFVPGAGVFAQ